ncbi:MAG: HAMP domain-containing histidine kinase [Candidatus Marinimicrobia bacterium]|nr:HAMP domain-containing histidine kinase [Candidatus Neomarinimicrobiota bacterium]MCF7827552.1 HAMP domain-containing histidine kinase [Candidatus Neomarinimicrobiota bacterium]MCF7881586.1 HAMP domain-containing histidine kinase [Candidatus Neomarinimicrobiota bacterium]
MNNKREFSLLTKTAFIYLVFTFIAFASSAIFLTEETNEFIDRELEIHFNKWEHRVKRDLKEDGDIRDRLKNFIQVRQVSDAVDTTAYPAYKDTVMTNPFSDDQEQFRQKSLLATVNDTTYQVSVTGPVEDYYRLRDDIYGSLIPAFILLAAGIVLFNILLSGFLFRPFNAILETMRTYKVGQETQLENVKTNTREFNRMQRLFHQMLDRIEEDYQHLKEYTENMSHEIQTPLAVIRNKVENLISDDAVMERHGEEIKILWDETNHLSKLGNTLNLITKIENREFEDFQTIQTQPVIRKHVRKVEEFTQLKSLEIELDLSDDHYIEIDPYLLDIMLKNLMGNAIRYASEEGPIRVKTTPESLVVCNYGSPLDFPEEKLFERFYQHGGNDESLGLGLALVQKICELNNLKITYKYNDNQHCFRIRKEKS